MLSNAYFYYQLTRRYVILFGNMFNNIMVKRINKDTGVEIERFKIPIMYAPKEKYVMRLASDPDLQREIQVTLPRMSFEITGITYDATRKQNSLLKNPKSASSTEASTQYVGVPYDLNFELNLYARNVDDGTHIVEQILPYFNPDYTATIQAMPQMGFLKDVPIILNSVTNNIEYEGNFDSVRYVTWTMTFTMKVHYYGPISKTKIIRKVDANIFNDPSLKAGNIINAFMTPYNANTGIYKSGDVVYQGANYQTATAYGFVLDWKPNAQKLTIGGAQGQFLANTIVRAMSSNATYTLSTFDIEPLQLVNIHIEPRPNTANPGDDFGYDIQIQEWPNIT
jgi:hypothetical protein